jgi:hypothetical protein
LLLFDRCTGRLGAAARGEGVPMPGRKFQVGFARVSVEGIFGVTTEGFVDALQQSWVSGAAVTRYGRTWRISRPKLLPNFLIWMGRIGFIKEGEVTTIGWDANLQDFRTEEASGGVVVPLALDTRSGIVGFQLRSGLIRATSFTGAFQGLLNENPIYRWRVEPLILEKSYDEWRGSIARITDAYFRLEVPNPNWRDRYEVERIIEELNADVTRLEARVHEGGSLDDASPLFRQALDHALDQYGRAVVRGVDAAQVESEWDSADGGRIPVELEVELEIEGDEIPEGDLAAIVAQREAEVSELRTGEPAEDAEA